ncbi:MAG: hypothetical protein JSW20_05560 [Nitrospiraceae bacterium]|nr:MAG: hypothetical protein JSW20_05560 [Nitrospiraceae bacterium]
MSKYQVIIPYREPTYETHSSKSDGKQYRAPYTVTALSKEDAIKEALDLFAKEALYSNVGWRHDPEYDQIEVKILEK